MHNISGCHSFKVVRTVEVGAPENAYAICGVENIADERRSNGGYCSNLARRALQGVHLVMHDARPAPAAHLDRRMLQPARTVGPTDDQAHRPVIDQAQVEKVQRHYHAARGKMLLDGERRPHDRIGVVHRVLASLLRIYIGCRWSAKNVWNYSEVPIWSATIVHGLIGRFCRSALIYEMGGPLHEAIWHRAAHHVSMHMIKANKSAMRNYYDDARSP
jgi:hypothetical protein